jgi:hypothetical protein
MIIFKCRFSGDEMLSDAFKPVNVKDADGNEVPGLIEIESIKVNKSGGEVDIGCGNEFGGEGGDEVEDTSEAVNNVIDETIGFDLHEVPMVSIFPKRKRRQRDPSALGKWWLFQHTTRLEGPT